MFSGIQKYPALQKVKSDLISNQIPDSIEKTLMLGKTEGKRRGQQWMGWLDGITDSMDMNLGEFQEIVRDRVAWHIVVHGVTELKTT